MSDPDLSLARIPFGRSKAIATVGAILFSVALRAAAPELARAKHLPIPQGCYGFQECHCCSGSNCCDTTCIGHAHSHGCPTQAQCWYTCVNGLTYQCCDFHVTWDGELPFCICRGFVEGPTC